MRDLMKDGVTHELVQMSLVSGKRVQRLPENDDAVGYDHTGPGAAPREWHAVIDPP